MRNKIQVLEKRNIKCHLCDSKVIYGEIHSVEKKDGGRKIIFETLLKYQEAGTPTKPQGSILKNGSSDPKKWTGICSVCQKNKAKLIKNGD